MPRRLTRAQIEAEGGGLAVEDGPGPAAQQHRKMTRAEIEAAGGGEAVDPQQPQQQVPDSLTEEGGLSHGPGTSFALNALDSLSVVGLPTTLAMKDALTGDAKDGDFRARYGKAKTFYEGGMKRLSDSNKKSALAGQMAPIATPGGAAGGLRGVLARGAVQGGLGGVFRGDAKTMEGDLKGTLVDAAVGTGAGTALSAAGYGAGKLLGVPFDLAKRAGQKGLARVGGDIADRVASEEGRFAKIQQMGQGARRNLPADIEAAEKTVPIARGPAKQVLADKMLAREAVKYGEGAKADAVANKAKWGARAAPPRDELAAKAGGDIQKESWQGAKQLIGTAAAGAAGWYGGKALGLDPTLSALAVGGAGRHYLMRKAAMSAANNPAVLAKLVALEPVSRALGRMGAKGATAPKNVAAIVYALREHPEVARVLKEHAASSSGHR